MLQKLLQRLERLEMEHHRASSVPHSVPGMIEYEVGRRTGVVQGIQITRETILAFMNDEAQEDETL